MSTPSAHFRHQSSLEGLMDMVESVPRWSAERRAQATRIFNTIIEAYEPEQHNTGPYRQVTLLRLTLEYVHTDESRDSFLHFFFHQTRIPSVISELDLTKISTYGYGPRLTAFADTLIEHFFLPLKASARKTPQPSPATSSALQSVHPIVGTTQRLASLRKECLTRDHYRCVISRVFDFTEMEERFARDGTEEARDDEGNLLEDQMGTGEFLQVAHIIPHSLMMLQNGRLELESKKIALQILNMFDHGVTHMINGAEIDRSYNAITLTHKFHQLFGDFKVYFNPERDQRHTYQIDSIQTGRVRGLPVTRTLSLTPTRSIDPPAARLLAVHSAIAHILHLSAAGPYIDKILKDLDEKDVMADGSTALGHLATLRLGGWWNGQIRAY